MTQIGLASVQDLNYPKVGVRGLLFDIHVSQATNGNCFMGFGPVFFDLKPVAGALVIKTLHWLCSIFSFSMLAAGHVSVD